MGHGSKVCLASRIWFNISHAPAREVSKSHPLRLKYIRRMDYLQNFYRNVKKKLAHNFYWR
jgi:predicted metal-binding transcription factor (methanogenesis marker protein 9)